MENKKKKERKRKDLTCFIYQRRIPGIFLVTIIVRWFSNDDKNRSKRVDF